MKKHLKRLMALTLASVMLIQSPAVCYADNITSESGKTASEGHSTSGHANPDKRMIGYGFRISFVDATGNLYTWRDANCNTHRTTSVDVLNNQMWNTMKKTNKFYVVKYSTDSKGYSNRK